MRNFQSVIDQITILRKRAEADSLEMIARRLRQEADELERNLLSRDYARQIQRG